MRYLLAIDPGASGAIVHGTGFEDLTAVKMPESAEGIRDMFSILGSMSRPGPGVAWMERNTGFMAGIKSSTKRKGEEDSEEGGVSPKAMYSFGRNTGHLEMACVFAGFDLKFATPLKWMNALAIVTGRKRHMTPGAWKNILKEECVSRYDGILDPKRITLANADALLIYYGIVTGRLR